MARLNITLPDYIHSVLDNFASAGFTVYLVGGAVRNLLMGEEPHDWDLTTNARPEEIVQLFPNGFLDNKFGTVGVPIKYLVESNISPVPTGIIEITTFRREGKYTDFRHPEIVEWGQTIEEDLARRDFTINAMAVGNDGALIDPYWGKADLEAQVIRTVGDPSARFSEDALRLIRAIRLSVQLQFTIEPTTYLALAASAHLLQYISGERIRAELLKILAAQNAKQAANGFSLLYETGLLAQFLPELVQAFQQPQARHHKYDVGTHLVLSLQHCPSKDPLVRLAALLHDIGKPAVAKKEGLDEEGKPLITFYNHEVAGVSIARKILDRLHFGKKERDRILNLIRWHQFTVDEHITDAAIRRFIARVGPENVDDMLDLRIGDRLGGGCREAESWRLRLFKKRIWEVQHPPPTISDLAIDGYDVMKTLSLKPGPKVGQILKQLFAEIIDEPEKNNRECLLKRLIEIK